MADETRTTGMGLWTDANEMLAAAKHLSAVKDFEFSQPLYYLLGHSLELSFKSYVRANGASLNCLKSIGHDLNLALDWALTGGLEKLVTITEADKQLVSLVNTYYKAKEFEYRKTGIKEYPHAKDLISLTERVLKATKSPCARSVRP